MILWHKKVEHPPGFVEKLEKQIISQHDSKSYFTTYIDGRHKNDPILDEELDNHIKDFYREVVTEMMKDVGIHGYLDYETKDGNLRDSYWVQMYNSETDSHFIHDHHGCGAFISWVQVLKALQHRRKHSSLLTQEDKNFILHINLLLRCLRFLVGRCME